MSKTPKYMQMSQKYQVKMQEEIEAAKRLREQQMQNS